MKHDVSQAAVEGWRQRLHALFDSRLRAPFAWGSNDCVLFAADAVKAQTSKDHASAHRGTYADAAGAARVLAALGGLEALGALAGPAIPPLAAALGDVGLAAHEGRELLAVSTGQHWVAPSARGLAVLPMNAARKAWRVSRG